MARMVPHASPPLDHGGHPGQDPPIGAEPVRSRPLAQHPVELLQLSAVEFRLATCPASRSQRTDAALPPLPVPPTDTLAAHLEGSGDRRQNRAGAEQLGGLLSSIFQGLEIPSWTYLRLPASLMQEAPGCVTIFCGIQ